MNISGHKLYHVNTDCPNLNEWTEWGSSFCRLRYMAPEVLTKSEIREYCKNDNHCKCVFYMRQVDMVSKTYQVHAE